MFRFIVLVCVIVAASAKPGILGSSLSIAAAPAIISAPSTVGIVRTAPIALGTTINAPLALSTGLVSNGLVANGLISGGLVSGGIVNSGLLPTAKLLSKGLI